MGSNTLGTRSSGETITADFFNDFNTALNNDHVPRNSSGVPTSGGGSLGTAAFPWQSVRTNALIVNGSTVDVTQVAAPAFRVVSGLKRSTSNQPVFLKPNGAAAQLSIEGAATNLVYEVSGASVTLSSDITLGSLTTAASTNNTCLVNDTDAADQTDTRLWGEENPYATKKEITIDTIGTEISSLDGKLAAFSHGAGPEYFLARVDTTNNRLHKCMRGFFFNSSDAPVKREVFSNNDTITLMKLGWVFLENDATTIDVTYNEPAYSTTAPSTPATGDYWFDFNTNLWKRYDGASFQIVSRTFVGMVVLDSTNCVAARSVDFDARFKKDNELELEIQSVEIARAKVLYGSVNVFGNEIFFGPGKLPTWNITTNLASSSDMYNATEQASTYYGLYLADDGKTIISDIEPMYRSDVQALVHPFNPWRFIGECFNDSGSDITRIESDYSQSAKLELLTANDHGSTDIRIRRFSTRVIETGTSYTSSDSVTLGEVLTVRRDGRYAIQYSDSFNVGAACAITRNETPTSIALSVENAGVDGFRLALEYPGGATNTAALAWCGELNAGDIIRFHTTGDANSSLTGQTTAFFERMGASYV